MNGSGLLTNPARQDITAMPSEILIVKNADDSIRALTAKLKNAGYAVRTAKPDSNSLATIRGLQPHLIILGWARVEGPGTELCRLVRAERSLRNCLIVILSTRCEEAEIVRGFDMGADDYIVKPFSVIEAVARIRALFRREALARSSVQLKHLDIVVDRQARRVTHNGVEI
jgi:two-component system phosphate regulon response regulator PhoB